MRPVVILKTGSSLPELVARRGDYEDWIAEGLGLERQRLRVVPVHEGAEPPDPGRVAAALVTGSSSMVSSREAWSEKAGAWLGQAVRRETPLLGICFGHQLLAQALGGRVGPNPRGREIGSIEVQRLPQAAGDPLFAGLRDPLRVQATHVEAVLELPAGARLLASSRLDPHQAFAVGRRAWGVQFHPEFDAEVIRAYLAARSQLLRGEGLDPEALLGAVTDAPDGRALLRRFARLAALG